MRLATMIPALLCLAACSMAPRPDVDAVVRRVPLAVDLAGREPERVEVRARHGQVVVTGGSELRCELWVDVPIRPGDDADDFARGLRLSPLGDSAVLRLMVEPPPGLSPDAIHPHFRLVLPDHVALEVVTHDADVTVRGHGGDMTLRTESGRIRAALAGGTCAIANRDGLTQVEGQFRSARITTSSGATDVTLPPIVDGPGELSLDSRTGNVKLRAEPHAALDIRFETATGVLLCELPLRWTRTPAANGEARTDYAGRLGDADRAATSVRVATASGDLELLRARETELAAAGLRRADSAAAASH
jgi:hypothetical protein